MLPRLENWIQFHDCLVGEAYQHPEFQNGTRVKSNYCYELDHKLKVAKCTKDEVWLLGKPGNYADYLVPPKPKSIFDRILRR